MPTRQRRSPARHARRTWTTQANSAAQSYCPCDGQPYTWNDHCRRCGHEEYEEACWWGQGGCENRYSRTTGRDYRRMMRGY